MTLIAQDLVTRLGKGLRHTLTNRLAEAGILERKQSRVLGLFPRTTWPAADRAREDRLRRDLTSALVEVNEPGQRTAAIIALLVAVGRAHRTVPREGLSRGEVKSRAKRIAEDNWAAKAVRDAIAAATAATTAAATAAATGAAAAAT
jgi:hypothetical protein